MFREQRSDVTATCHMAPAPLHQISPISIFLISEITNSKVKSLELSQLQTLTLTQTAGGICLITAVRKHICPRPNREHGVFLLFGSRAVKVQRRCFENQRTDKHMRHLFLCHQSKFRFHWCAVLTACGGGGGERFNEVLEGSPGGTRHIWMDTSFLEPHLSSTGCESDLLLTGNILTQVFIVEVLT